MMVVRRRSTIAFRALVVALLALVLAGCTGGAPILANAPVARPAAPATPTPAPRPSDPIPIELPRDDGTHDRLTEWWYYTGHLRDAAGGRWGFEYVVFRAERGSFPVSWASHLALTDETGHRFLYAQRTEIGPQVDVTASAGGAEAFDFRLSGGTDPAAPVWQMRGGSGRDALRASATSADTAAIPFGLDLSLRATRPATLHDRDGWIDFGPAGGSYYYSRTRMAATGSIEVGGRQLTVDGTAWFDHQWGDFIAVGGGGWDWFAMNLDDGTDLTLSLVRDADGTYPLVYGTLVTPRGETRHLPASAFTVHVTDHWRSARTGATYPAGWRISVPSEGLEITLTPTVADQELDTRPSTGVVYWEGSQRVAATRDGRALGGEAYVELTGYAPSR
jgi:predicted secreted hydrolase